ncbi:HNH endonuclease [Alkalicoccobacillus plakortidis]|uniref:HNH endonuclease n=1 Tax=Shouchella oshimensis TaxID=290588 RepID=UPI003530EA0D
MKRVDFNIKIKEEIRVIKKRGYCELCERENVATTIHHLLPKDEGGTFAETANLCIPCHKQIHALYTNKELASRLTTILHLKQDEKLRKFLKWIRKQPAETIPKTKTARHRKKRR